MESLRFSHWLVRRVEYEAMLPDQRRELHRAAASTTERKAMGDATPEAWLGALE